MVQVTGAEPGRPEALPLNTYVAGRCASRVVQQSSRPVRIRVIFFMVIDQYYLRLIYELIRFYKAALTSFTAAAHSSTTDSIVAPNLLSSAARACSSVTEGTPGGGGLPSPSRMRILAISWV